MILIYTHLKWASHLSLRAKMFPQLTGFLHRQAIVRDLDKKYLDQRPTDFDEASASLRQGNTVEADEEDD